MEIKSSRREFLKQFGSACIGLAIAPTLLRKAFPKTTQNAEPYIREARYYKKLPHQKIECTLCPKGCIIDNLERGYCGVRENQGGIYKTLVYGRLCSINIDPIEKKPLFHFLPGTTALSIATAGCNVNCKFCQNWSISQVRPEEVPFRYVSPEALAQLAIRYQSPTIAYTYNEPVIFTEYMYDSAVAGKERGIRSVMISNGYINREPMMDLCKVLDAVKIDFKAFSEKFYRELVSGELKPVLNTMVLLKEQNKFFEMVYLVIPTCNDDSNEIRDMCKWIISNLGPDVPLHFTRFHPQYLMKNLPPTPVKTLETAHSIAKDAGINFVYIGNVPGHQAENTYCPNCGKVIIERRGYMIRKIDIKNGKCIHCQTKVPGIWS